MGSGGLGTAISTALSGGFATALGGLIPIFGAVALAISALKGKTTELDSGLLITTTGMESMIEVFSEKNTSYLFGLINKKSTSVDLASSQIADPIMEAAAGIQVGVMAAADALGIGSWAFDNFTHELEFSTKGMTESEALSEIESQLYSMGDAFASMVPNLEAAIREGETASTTLDRLATDLTGVNLVMTSLGYNLLDTSVVGGEAASAMAAVFGGLDNFLTGTQTYFQNYYSLEEQIAEASRQFNVGLSDLGVGVIPQTEAELRGLVDSLMNVGRTAEAAGVIGLSSLMTDILMLEEQAELASSQVNALNNSTATYQSLHYQVMEMQGRENAMRDETLASLNAAEAAMQQNLWALEEQAAAATAAASVASERTSLEREYYALIGDTAALRAMEMEQLDPTNRALQETIWMFEDLESVAASLSASNFGSLLDYNRAIAGAANTPYNPAYSPASIPTSQGTTQQAQIDTLTEEVRRLTAVVQSGFDDSNLLQGKIATNTRMSKDTLRLWETNGMPQERSA